MDLHEVKKLLILLAANEQTKQQEEDFINWLNNASKEDYSYILNLWEEILEHKTFSTNIESQEFIFKMESRLNEVDIPIVPLYPKAKSIFKPIAVAVLLLICSIGLLIYQKSLQPIRTSIVKSANGIKPGGNRAILTLADGSKIDLNEVNKGEIANQQGIKIVKNSNGQLVYTIPVNAQPNAIKLFNSIETPNGGQYQVNLPDGSRVWLNASSSLRFPVAFDQNERKVELTGEAYFEIEKDKTKPFRVISKNQTVEVLGTHFNINSYKDEENVKTTLLEGSIRLQSSKFKSIVLNPGQQAQLDEFSLQVKDVDIYDIAAWKDGYFVFDNESLPSVMRKIARWYDLEIVYQGNIQDKDLAGTISKYKNVNDVLKVLELTGLVHFSIEGRKIIVKSN